MASCSSVKISNAVARRVITNSSMLRLLRFTSLTLPSTLRIVVAHMTSAPKPVESMKSTPPRLNTTLLCPAALASATFSRSAVASLPSVMRPFMARISTPSRSCCWISSGMSDGHLDADARFHFSDVDHLDRVPRAAIEKRAVRTFAGALLAADAEERIDLDVPEGRMVLVRHPVHAIGHRAIRHARGRTRASGAAFGDDRKLFGPLFAGRGDAFGLRLHLQDSR